jgi:hypothetical protein
LSWRKEERDVVELGKEEGRVCREGGDGGGEREVVELAGKGGGRLVGLEGGSREGWTERTERVRGGEGGEEIGRRSRGGLRGIPVGLRQRCSGASLEDPNRGPKLFGEFDSARNLRKQEEHVEASKNRKE